MRRLLPTVLWMAFMWTHCAADYAGPSPSEHSAIRTTWGEAEGLEYVEVVPEWSRPAARLPLVVYLHGRGDRPRVPEEPFLGIRAPMRLILFRAPEPYHHGYSWLPVSAAKGETPRLVRALRDRSAQLARAIRALVERYPTQGAPVVVGFSQGGMLTLTLAVDYPDVVGSGYALAGWLPPTLMPTSTCTDLSPTLRAIHGALDPVLPASRTRDAMAHLREAGYEARFVEFPDVSHRMSRPMWNMLRGWIRGDVETRIARGRRFETDASTCVRRRSSGV